MNDAYLNPVVKFLFGKTLAFGPNSPRKLAAAGEEEKWDLWEFDSHGEEAGVWITVRLETMKLEIPVLVGVGLDAM